MPEFKTLRGMRDLLPDDARIMIYVENIARIAARLYGYKEIITPVVEPYELLAAKAGDEVRSRMFTFKDMGGRAVALRPEFTASIARLVATTLRNEPKPLRLFSMGSSYRYDEPQQGRYREFWQSDYELIGSSRPEADAEIIMITDNLMRGAGLKYSMKVGHVGILRGLLGQEKVGEKEQNSIMQLMDRKQYEEAFTLAKNAGASKKCLAILHQLIECRSKDIPAVLNKIEGLVENYEKATAATGNLREILRLVSRGNCDVDVTVDAGFARGLEYYTGMVYEIYVPDLDIALGGGGRYDRLIELFGGEPAPAVGVAHGTDRIVLGMQWQKTKLKMEKEKMTAVIPIKKELVADALRISQVLRKAGITAELEVMGRKTTKALEDANRRKMDYAIIVGERELKEGSVVLRDLTKREQKTVSMDKVVDEIES